MKHIFLVIIFFVSVKVAFSQNLKADEEKYIDLTNQKALKSSNEIKDVSKPILKESIKKLENKKINQKKVISQNNVSVKIGSLKAPSLGSIGIKTKLNKKFGLNLWNKFTAEEAIRECK